MPGHTILDNAFSLCRDALLMFHVCRLSDRLLLTRTVSFFSEEDFNILEEASNIEFYFYVSVLLLVSLALNEVTLRNLLKLKLVP